METVFVVICSSGEYSDRYEWVAGVYTDKEEAIKIAAKMLAVSKAADAEYWMWHRKYEDLIKPLRPRWPDPLWLRPITEEEQSAIVAEIGEKPRGGVFEDYYITEAPLNQWGRWEGMLNDQSHA